MSDLQTILSAISDYAFENGVTSTIIVLDTLVKVMDNIPNCYHMEAVIGAFTSRVKETAAEAEQEASDAE